MRVWLDCEFTSFEAPELLSVALVAEDRRECYIELLDPRLRPRCSEFVQQNVLPLMGRLPAWTADDYQTLCDYLERFLLGIGTVELLYDERVDRELVQAALEHGPRYQELRPQVSWRNVSIETCGDAAQDAMEGIFNAAVDIGLGRHHALVDARALRLAHLVGGED